jgi:hypothetical protein
MARKVLYFTAGMEATADEAAEIAAIVGNVQIRNALVPATYGDGRLEPADALAGAIPAAYLTASGGTAVDTALYPDGDVTPNNTVGIAALKLFNLGGNITANGGTRQMVAVKAVYDPETGGVVLTDVTTACAWTSATTGKGTVGASTGIVTGANGGAGTSVITASYDWDGAGSETPLTATATATFA